MKKRKRLNKNRTTIEGVVRLDRLQDDLLDAYESLLIAKYKPELILHNADFYAGVCDTLYNILNSFLSKDELIDLNDQLLYVEQKIRAKHL